MTALAQGCAGLALVMGFALLITGQITAAAILLAVQSAAVAITAVVLHQPLMAIPPVVLAAGIWLVRHETADPRTAPRGGAKLGIGIGAVLAILCQSLGVLAMPSAVLLLAILLAATRSHMLMQVMALVAAQNGIALAAGLAFPLAAGLAGPAAALPAALLLPLACLVLPLPLAAGLLLPGFVRWQPIPALVRFASWLGWADLVLALGILAAALIVPHDPLARLFAPLLALDGVMRSIGRRTRPALTATRRGAALAQTGFTVLAVCAPDLERAWLAVLAAIAMTLLPALSRRWSSAVLAFLAAGLALFAILLLPAAPAVLGWFSLFAGFAAIAALVPDLAPVVVILILRLATHSAWPPAIEALGTGIAALGLLACAALLTNRVRPYRASLLLLSQASIAALALCPGQAEGRFAALVLLILLILARSAARFAHGQGAALAIASLGGAPPFALFPGLVLVVLALAAGAPWLLLPLGVALVPVVLASLPDRMPAGPAWPLAGAMPRLAIPSAGWLPLLLALLAGYCAPDDLVQWWHVLTAGAP
jgi:hypothetical protein